MLIICTSGASIQQLEAAEASLAIRLPWEVGKVLHVQGYSWHGLSFHHSAVLYSTVQHSTVQRGTALTAQYSTVQYTSVAAQGCS